MHKQTESLRKLIENLEHKRKSEINEEFGFSNVTDLLLGQTGEVLYRGQFRFILELIQNAVDSSKEGQKISVQFSLRENPNEFVVSNNGRPFDEDDIRRICGDYSTPKGNKKIGYKGIGFKSVMGITHNPQIYSDTCYFEFDKNLYPDKENIWMVIPHWIESKQHPETKKGWVTFRLPFRNDFSGIQSLAEYLDKLPPQLLLFLDKLKSIEIYNEHRKQHRSISKCITDDYLVHIEQHLRCEHQDKERREIGYWITIRHSPTLPLSNEAKDAYLKQRKLDKDVERKGIDIRETEIVVAFEIDDNGDFVKTDSSSIYAFFPVSSQQSGLQFLVQADFLTTTSRDNLDDGNPWNKWLIQNLPDAIEASLEVLKQSNKWRLLIYEALPLTGEIKEPFNIIEKELQDRLRNSRIVLTDMVDELGQPIWLYPHEAVWLPNDLQDLLTDSDLQQLMSEKCASVSKDLSSSRARTFLTSSNGLGIKKINKNDMLKFLENDEWLSTKTVDWFIFFFAYLNNLDLKESGLQTLRKLRIIPTEEGLSAPEENIFLPVGEEISGAKFVNSKLANASEEICSFLTEGLKIAQGNQETLIEKVVIPELEQGYQALGEDLLEEYVAFVKYYFDYAKDALNSDLGKKLRSCLPLRAADNSWQLAKELCLKADEKGQYTKAGDLLDGADDRYFVAFPDLQPIDTLNCIKFYEWLGVHSQPTVSILLDSLGTTEWCKEKPPKWFRSLYGYLNSEAGKLQIENIKQLEIVLVSSDDDLIELKKPTEKIFFASEDTDLHQFGNVFADDNIQFVHPEILQSKSDENLQAKHLLEKLGIEEINRHTLLERIVIEEFKRCDRIGDYSDKLLKYTRFALDIFYVPKYRWRNSVMYQFRSNVRLKTTTGEWKSPSEDIYLTTKYGANDFETLLEGFGNVYFISSEYIELEPKLSRDKWEEFFTKLRVNERLPVTVINDYQNASDLVNGNDGRDYWEDYFEILMDQIVEKPDSEVLDSFDNRHQICGNAYIKHLDAILKTQDKKRFEVLIKVFGDYWEGNNGYSQLMELEYRYRFYKWHSLEIGSYLLYQLCVFTGWFPTTNGLQFPCELVYCDTEEIRQLAGNKVSYLTIEVPEIFRYSLVDFLGIRWSPEEVFYADICDNLRHLKDTNSATAEQCAKIYQALAEGTNDYYMRFKQEQEALIFLPKQCQWWTPDKLFWSDYSETFGRRRGYITIEPAYHSLFDAFDKLGVNTGNHNPKDFADLLIELGNDNDADERNIWKCYRQLENFLRENDGTPEWWSDFTENIKLLTQQDDFQSAKEVYIPDNLKLCKLFRDTLAFIKMPESESFRSFETLFDKLELHRVSKDIKVIHEVGEVIRSEDADSIRESVIKDRSFIKSILAHRYPEQEKNFQKILDNLFETSDFEVCFVDNLDVAYHLKDKTENKRSETEKYFYFPREHTLYLLNKNHDTIGCAVASMFETLGDLHNSDFMLLFSKQSEGEKRQLLEEDLGIKVLKPTDTTPILTTSPDEVELPLSPSPETETIEEMSHLIKSESEGDEILIDSQSHSEAPYEIDLKSVTYDAEAHLDEQKETKSVFWEPSEKNEIATEQQKTSTRASPDRTRHDRLRDYLAKNPKCLESELCLPNTEHSFPSVDRADIVLETADGIPVAVEVEVEVPTGNLVGLWQAIKYKHLLAVEKGYLCEEVRAFLVAHKIADDIKQQCPEYGVEWKEIIEENEKKEQRKR